MKRNCKILTITLILLATVFMSEIAISQNVKRKVKEMFKMNKTLQEEGYYMGDFEFKMLGLGYYLNKGRYRKALKTLNDYHKKLSNREGLIKIPKFKNHQEERVFYLNLQNPKTGAFIDESVPYCTYYEVSRNVIGHIVALTDSTTTPLKLNYPLKFLDEINTPEKLTAFLDDVSYINWLASKFPQTTFHFARNILSEAIPGSLLERYNLYSFSPECKHTMLKWMYNFQDTATGLWGPKNKRTHKLVKYDLNNTASILNNYRDDDGNDRYTEFPLKYQDKLFKSAINQLSESFPREEDLSEIHEWNLRQSKGIKMLLRYLWKDASADNKRNAQRIITRQIDICFDKYYVRNEGAFSYYPNAKHASGDGSTNLLFRHIGAFSFEKQKRLWGDPSENTKDMGELVLNELKPSNLNLLNEISGINSFRMYISEPNYKHLSDSVWAIFYPNDTMVLDIMELVPNVVKWTETCSLSMGNWTSLADIKAEYSKLNIKKPLIYKKNLPFDEVNKKFEKGTELYIVGFDKLQVPRWKIKFKHKAPITIVYSKPIGFIDERALTSQN